MIDLINLDVSRFDLKTTVIALLGENYRIKNYRAQIIFKIHEIHPHFPPMPFNIYFNSDIEFKNYGMNGIAIKI